MSKLCALAAAGLFVVGLSSTASAAPIIVTYGIGPGGSASWTPSVGTGGSGNAGGQMVIVYTSGSPTLGGTLGTQGTMQAIQLSFTMPGDIFGNPIPGMGVGVGALGTRSAGGVGNFGGATYVPVGAFGGGQPPVTIMGNMAAAFAPLGAITVALNGSGTQVLGGAINAAWTITNVVGAEISRQVVPEPGTGALLLGGLIGIAAYGARRVRR